MTAAATVFLSALSIAGCVPARIGTQQDCAIRHEMEARPGETPRPQHAANPGGCRGLLCSGPTRTVRSNVLVGVVVLRAARTGWDGGEMLSVMSAATVVERRAGMVVLAAMSAATVV